MESTERLRQVLSQSCDQADLLLQLAASDGLITPELSHRLDAIARAESFLSHLLSRHERP